MRRFGHAREASALKDTKRQVGSRTSSTTPALAQDIADQAGCRNGGQDRKRALHKGFLHIVFRPALFGLVQKHTCELGRRPRRQRGGQDQNNPLLHILAQALASSAARPACESLLYCSPARTISRWCVKHGVAAGCITSAILTAWYRLRLARCGSAARVARAFGSHDSE